MRAAASSRRGALGASLALHGAVAVAAVLPLLQAPTAPPSGSAVAVTLVFPGAASTDAGPVADIQPARPPEPEATDPPGHEPPGSSFPEAQDVPPETQAEVAVPVEVPPAAAEPARAEAKETAPLPAMAETVPAEEAPIPPPPAAPALSEPPAPTRAPATRPSAPPRQAAARPDPPARPAIRPGAAGAGGSEAAAPAAASAAAIAPSAAMAAASPLAPPARSAEGPILVTAPRYRRPPTPPAYPARAVEFGLTGTVLVRARVTPDGSTEETRLWRSSGHALLDAAAIAAVRRWAFEPASIEGRRVEAWVEVPVHFRLN